MVELGAPLDEKLSAAAGAAYADDQPDYLLYPYQRRWFEDQSRFKIGMFSRQVGKTWGTCGEIVDDVMMAEAQGRRTRWVILSRGQRQADEAMREGVIPWCKIYGLAIQYAEETMAFGQAGSEYQVTATSVTFPNGSRIIALPSTPDTARGFSANVMLDEFAFHQNSNEIWGSLFPVVSAGFKIRVISTPNGKGNKFYQLWTGKDDDWSRHHVDIYQAVADGCPRDIDLLRRNMKDDELWRQEFELEFLDEATAWLPYDLIQSCEHPDAGKPELYQGGRVFVGNDIGRRRDLWVAWVFEEVGDVLWDREMVVLRRATFAQQDAELDALIHPKDGRYQLGRLLMDQGGMGEKPVEDAQARYGGHRVDGVIFTPGAKIDLANVIKGRFEERRIRIRQGDQPLRDDLHKPQRIAGPTGLFRFVAESDASGHADRFWAGALGLSGAELGAAPAGSLPADIIEAAEQAAIEEGLPTLGMSMFGGFGTADQEERIAA